MTTLLSAGRRVLPRGWADLGRQITIWFGFAAAYQLARAATDRDPTRAFTNSFRVVSLELRVTNRLYELTIEQFVVQRHWLAGLVSWTYWNSEFTVVGLALLWVYIVHHEAFTRFRNSILLANMIGLFGYVFMPMAPPRLLGLGFVNSHRDGLITLAANPYASMPSLHACDSLIVGIVLVRQTRHWWAKAFWSVWPAWVWFAVVATGNHFWLDCVAGMFVALFAMAIAYEKIPVVALLRRRVGFAGASSAT